MILTRDTVSSIGIIPRELPYSTTVPGVKTFRHALALDESRARFRPKVWNEPTPIEQEILHDVPEPFELPQDEERDWDFHPQVSGADVLEVWFAGA